MIDLSNVEKQIKSDEAAVPNFVKILERKFYGLESLLKKPL